MLTLDADKVLAQVCVEWHEVDRLIARGKGVWNRPGYVPDDVWHEWRARRETLRRILRAGGIDPDVDDVPGR